jgi:hypothetical protein
MSEILLAFFASRFSFRFNFSFSFFFRIKHNFLHWLILMISLFAIIWFSRLIRAFRDVMTRCMTSRSRVIKFRLLTIVIECRTNRWKRCTVFWFIVFSSDSILWSVNSNLLSYFLIEFDSWDVQFAKLIESKSKLRMRDCYWLICFWRMTSSIMSRLNDTMSIILNAWRIMNDLNVYLRNDWNAVKNFNLSNSMFFIRTTLFIVSTWYCLYN